MIAVLFASFVNDRVPSRIEEKRPRKPLAKDSVSRGTEKVSVSRGTGKVSDSRGTEKVRAEGLEPRSKTHGAKVTVSDEQMEQSVSPKKAVKMPYEDNLFARADRALERSKKIRDCLTDAEPIVADFEKRSGEQATARDAKNQIEAMKMKADEIAQETETIAADGYLDGHTEEELMEAMDKQEEFLEQLTKEASLILALSWDRMR